MSRDRLRATNAETIVKKIKRLFYNDYYVNHYINYDYSLQKLYPHGAIE